jgi:hypothetical protein
MKRIFGSKKEEVAGRWRGLHNEELHNLHGSPDIIRVIKSRRIRREGHITRMGETRNIYKILVERPRRRWEDNIRMDLKRNSLEGSGLDTSGSG